MKIELYPAHGKIETFDKDMFTISFADPTQKELDSIDGPDIEGQVSPEEVYAGRKLEELINLLTTVHSWRIINC